MRVRMSEDFRTAYKRLKKRHLLARCNEAHGVGAKHLKVVTPLWMYDKKLQSLSCTSQDLIVPLRGDFAKH